MKYLMFELLFEFHRIDMLLVPSTYKYPQKDFTFLKILLITFVLIQNKTMTKLS